MAKLYFRWGCMNSGKSFMLAAAGFNYQERGMRVIVAKPTVDTKSVKVLSRIGLESDVDWPVAPEASLLELFHKDQSEQKAPLRCIIVDEAQFLTPQQVDELYEIVILHSIPVMAYGLRGDFQTHAFPGSMRLMELAHSLEEIKTICRCGSKAVFNARLINGVFVNEGSQVAIDGQAATYEALCGACYFDKVGKPTAG